MKEFTVTAFDYSELCDSAKIKIADSIITGWLECPDLVPEYAKEGYQKAIDEMERNQTPWFSGEAVYEYCKDEIAHDATYAWYTADGKFFAVKEDEELL